MRSAEAGAPRNRSQSGEAAGLSKELGEAEFPVSESLRSMVRSGVDYPAVAGRTVTPKLCSRSSYAPELSIESAAARNLVSTRRAVLRAHRRDKTDRTDDPSSLTVEFDPLHGS
jgi:hypothetical protein